MTQAIENKNGKLAVKSEEFKPSPELLTRIRHAEGKLGKAKSAQRTMKQEIAELEMKLADNPIFQKILKLKRKVVMAGKFEREASVEVSAAYEELTKNMPGQKRLVDMFDEIIADQVPRKMLGKGKR